MVTVAAVVVDNGDRDIFSCIESLLNQTLKLSEIVVVPGPRTPTETVEKLKRIGIKVLEPVKGIGRARIRGIEETKADIVLSCDSDSEYDKRYAEEAVKTLKQHFKAVKAGTVIPKKWSFWALLELPLATILPYEFGLAFWRNDLLSTSAPRVAQEVENPLWDIGPVVAREMMPVAVNPRMVVKTRLPTHAVKHLVETWVPQVIGSATPIAAAIGIATVEEFSKSIRQLVSRAKLLEQL
jgi:glycosyltransferase involved in cell wall biosynthesis